MYDNGGATDITGLTSGTAYYVIADGGGQIKLAATQEKALKGEAIVLAPGGGVGGMGQSLTEAHHGYGAKATSGAGSSSVGLAGALAITVVRPIPAPGWLPAAR